MVIREDSYGMCTAINRQDHASNVHFLHSTHLNVKGNDFLILSYVLDTKSHFLFLFQNHVNPEAIDLVDSYIGKSLPPMRGQFPNLQR